MGKTARLEARIDAELKASLKNYCSERGLSESAFLTMVITKVCGSKPSAEDEGNEGEGDVEAGDYKDVWIRFKMKTYNALTQASSNDGITIQAFIRRLVHTSLLNQVQVDKESEKALRESNRELGYIGRGVSELLKLFKSKAISEKDAESMAKLVRLVEEIEKHKNVVNQVLNENWNRYDVNR